MKKVFVVEVALPDEQPMTDKEVVEAMESGVRAAVLKLHNESLPFDHQAWSTKFRSLPDEKKHELKTARKGLERDTTVVIVEVRD